MPSHYTNHTHAPVLSLTRIISPRMILEASARLTRWNRRRSAFERDRLYAAEPAAGRRETSAILAGNNPHSLVPNATFSGIISNSPNTSLNARFPLRGAETPVSRRDTHETRGAHHEYGVYWSAGAR